MEIAKANPDSSRYQGETINEITSDDRMFTKDQLCEFANWLIRDNPIRGSMWSVFNKYLIEREYEKQEPNSSSLYNITHETKSKKELTEFEKNNEFKSRLLELVLSLEHLCKEYDVKKMVIKVYKELESEAAIYYI